MQGTRTAYSIFSHFLISTRHLLAYPLALEEKIEKTGEIPCKNRNKGMAPEVGLARSISLFNNNLQEYNTCNQV